MRSSRRSLKLCFFYSNKKLKYCNVRFLHLVCKQASKPANDEKPTLQVGAVLLFHSGNENKLCLNDDFPTISYCLLYKKKREARILRFNSMTINLNSTGSNR